MLKISKLADYAMVLMHALAEQAVSLSAKQLAELSNIPLPTVSKVLKLLSDANLVEGSRGALGGYRLVQLPQAISVAAVLQAIDGHFALTECNLPDNSCTLSQYCGLRSNWQSINQRVLNLLEKISIADMQQPLPVESVHD
jgi:FeS assembly SUF system regulator